MRRIDTIEREQLFFERTDRWFRGIEIASLAGSEIAIVARVGERRGAAILLYQLDKARGEIGRDEFTQLKQLRLVAWQALHPLPLEQPCARRFAGTCHGSGG